MLLPPTIKCTRSCRWRLDGFLLAVCVICGSLALAEAQTVQGSAGRTQLSGQIELARLVDLCAERLGLQVEYDAGILKGAVALRLNESLSDTELWLLTNHLLATRGFATVRPPGSDVLSVVKAAEASGRARVEGLGPGTTDAPPAGFVNVVTRIRHRAAKEIVEAAKLMLSKDGGSIAELGSSGLLLISDLQPRVDEVLKLIGMLDVPAAPPEIRRIPTQFQPASKLAALVTGAVMAADAITQSPTRGKVIPSAEDDAVLLVCPQSDLEYWRSLIERLDARQPVRTETYTARHFGAQDVAKLLEQTARDQSPRGSGTQWKTVADPLTGALILTATPSEHERAGAIIQRLNAVPAGARRPIRVFTIRNRSVTEILEVLTSLLEAGVLEEAESAAASMNSDASEQPGAPQTNITMPELTKPATQPDQHLPGVTNRNVVPNRSGAAQPVASGRPSLASALTLTADEGTNTLIAFGESRLLAQLADLIQTLDVRQPQVMLEVTIASLSDSDSLNLGVELRKFEIVGNTTISLSSLFGLSPASGPPTSGRGFTASILSPGDFSVVVRALQTLNRGRTLSLPRVLVNNNQKASLDSVLQQPFTSVNATNTIATTSFGGSESAGTIITIKPQIAEGDHLILEYSVSLSAFVGEAADPALPPPKQSNNLSSVVTVPDGYTVVLGGLEIASDTDGVSQVPLIGDIPLIGEAFKNRSRSNSRTRFYVFIRSEVLRHTGFEDLKYISDREVAAVGGIDDGWPEVKPRIIR